MHTFSKKHNPEDNANILAEWFNKKDDGQAEAALETFHLMDDLLKSSLQSKQTYKRNFKKPWQALIRLLLTTKKAPSFTSSPSYIIKEGLVYPSWFSKLEMAFEVLKRKAVREVNVVDFGAVGDGKTDNTKAFIKAIAKGKRIVYIPEGIYFTEGIRLPSYTILRGAGKGKTILKLSDSAPKKARLLTNANHIRGNHHLYIEDLTLDWNVDRLPSNERTSAGNNRSSCLTFAHVTYGWVKNVEAINPGLHCFDVSSTVYTYFGDGTRSRGQSKYVWLDRLNGYGFGDDGITTHHSEQILITNSHMCDPSGRAHRKGYSNSNGFEVDDGSNDVWLIHNSSARCFGGIEVKAHDTASAASNVHIIGHLSIHDNRSYNFRHIGHHHADEPHSQSAYNITATQIVSVAPVFTKLYKNSSPRCLVVSAYQNVVINHFELKGDPEYNYLNHPMISLQYKCSNVSLNHVRVQGFRTAGADIQVSGGKQHAERIHIQDVELIHSAPVGISIGQGIQKATVQGIAAKNRNALTAIRLATGEHTVSNIHCTGYHLPIMKQNKKNTESQV